MSVQTGQASVDVMVQADDTAPTRQVGEAIARAGGVGSGGDLDVPGKPGVVWPADDETLAGSRLRHGVTVAAGGHHLARVERDLVGVQLQVVGGPAAGVVIQLPAGSVEIGRSMPVSWADDKLSRRHCRLDLAPDRVALADLGSSNGTFLDGVRVGDEAMEVVPGQMITVGDSLVQLRPAGIPRAVVEPGDPGWLNFLRPPRILAPRRELTIDVPPAPTKPPRRRIPWPAIVLPLVLGAVMLLIMKSPYFLIMMVMSPLMMIFNWISDRRSGASDYKQQLADYHTALAQAQHDLSQAVASEQARLRHEMPDPAQTWLTCHLPGQRLWERRRDDPDWLLIRLGSANLASTVKITGAQDGRDHLLAAVPVGVRLPDQPVVGLAGPNAQVDALLAWMILQLGAYHPTRDVHVTFLSSRAGTEWSWLQWLPHLRGDDPDGPTAWIGIDDTARAHLTSGLVGLVKARQDYAAKSQGSVDFPAHVVVLHGYRGLRNTPGLGQVLDDGAAVGVFVICCDLAEQLLPEECTSVCVFDPVGPDGAAPVRARLARAGQPVIDQVLIDQVQASWCEQAARELSPLIDVGADSDNQTLPGSSRLLDVIGLDPPTAEAIQARWHQSPRSTQAVVGELATGAFSLDIRRDGPHGLVAGTTGSGKSEFLQSLIASLAVVNRPDELNFVLIDYKGGSAFKDCQRLPHTVGLVTDLDGHLTLRALESLRAELRQREHQLAGADAKDIEDYQAGLQPGGTPMPRLMIIVDEFAALAQDEDLKDFVTGLVDIARRGRSLGVHLILATQRPAGVVSAEIKSNTNLRVALRVTDPADSVDVIDSPQAAHITKSTPGRGLVRLGHASLTAFQSARVGGRPPGTGQPTEIQAQPYLLTDLAHPILESRAEEEDPTIPTDLSLLVQACQEASRSLGITAAPPPWLPPLDPEVTLDQLLEHFPAATPTPDRLILPLGLTDIPDEQRRGLAVLDLDRASHLALVGTPHTGRSTALRTIGAAITRFTSPTDVHLYGVDYSGGNALRPLDDAPHTGAVISRDQMERLDRLTQRLLHVIATRQQTLARTTYADVAEQRANTRPPERLPYLVILFDGWEHFFQAHDNIDGGRLPIAWKQILREGTAAGIRVILTGDHRLALGDMSPLFDDKLLFHLPSPADYQVIDLPAKNVPATMPPGRGFRAADRRETQIALLTADPSGSAQADALRALAHQARRLHPDLAQDQKPFRVDVLPTYFSLAQLGELPAQRPDPTELAFAVGGDSRHLISFDTEHSPALLVAGGPRTGRSTVLVTLATLAARSGWQILTVTPRVSPLRDLTGPTIHGPYDSTSSQTELGNLLRGFATGTQPSLVLVDDAERLDPADWLPTLLDQHIHYLNDHTSPTSHALVAAATSAIGALYHEFARTLRACHTGLLLAPQGTQDADLFGLQFDQLPRSTYQQQFPPGGGYLIQTGTIQRVQTIWPEA